MHIIKNVILIVGLSLMNPLYYATTAMAIDDDLKLIIICTSNVFYLKLFTYTAQCTWQLCTERLNALSEILELHNLLNTNYIFKM